MAYLGFNEDGLNFVLVNYDSQTTIAFTKDPKYHAKTKHIDAKYNFVRYMVAHKAANMQYISMHKMVADPFTKPIPKDVYNGHVRSLGLRRC